MVSRTSARASRPSTGPESSLRGTSFELPASRVNHLRTSSLSCTSPPLGFRGQWDWLKPPGQYRDGPSNSLLAPSPQEEKDPNLTGLQQQPDRGSWRWKAITCLSLGLISVGCTSWRLAMADPAPHAHGRWPLPMGCQSVGLLWYGIFSRYIDFLTFNNFKDSMSLRCTVILRRKDTGWKLLPICQWLNGIFTICNTGAWITPR